MASKSRRSRLGKDDKNEGVSTDSPKTVGARPRRSCSINVVSNAKQDHYSKVLDKIYENTDVTPKKQKENLKYNKKNLNTNEILKDLDSSDDDVYSPITKNNTAGKNNKHYKILKYDEETITMKISIDNDKSTEYVIGAKEKIKDDNRLSETPRKLRKTVGDLNYNEDELMEKHQKEIEERMRTMSSKKQKNNKSEASKNVAEISPRKRLQQGSPQQELENYGVDENEMSNANQISSPPKRQKSEAGIEQTPKKKPDLDVVSTPRSGAKRKLDLKSLNVPKEPVNVVNNTRVTRRNSVYDTATNYREWSSSDDNMAKNGQLQPRILLSKADTHKDKSSVRRSTRHSSKKIELPESEDSEVENKKAGAGRNTRSRSKSLQPPVANKLEEPLYSPSKDMQKMNLNTPKSSRTLIIKLKKTPPKSTPREAQPSANTRRQSQRISKPRYAIEKASTEESADSSDNYEGAEEDSDSEEESESSGHDSADEFQAPVGRNRAAPKKNAATNKRVGKVSMDTPTKAISRMSLGTPSLDRHRRVSSILKPSTPLQEARAKLHVSVLPKSLPCREEQFNDIYSFLHARLSDGSGGCIYISGVPGTGKTATVSEVIRCLQKSMTKGELPEFEYVDINGMKLSEPRQAYVQIWKQMSGETKTWEESHKLLQNKFNHSSAKRRMTLLLVDELDLLCTKRQDVVYNLLDWPSKTNAKLVVVTIANTMDLPERVLMGKVTSRLGLTRLTFPPYNFKQLEEIVASRLRGINTFGGETIQLVARKVAAVSGDARRALDICRRSAEIAETNKRELVTMVEVKQALDEMIASPKIQAIKHCADMEKYFLQAVCSEVHRTGIEEVVFKNVYMQMETLCSLDGLKAPNVSIALEICAGLGSYRLLLTDHSRMDIHQRLLLNVSTDDVHFATRNVSA